MTANTFNKSSQDVSGTFEVELGQHHGGNWDYKNIRVDYSMKDNDWEAVEFKFSDPENSLEFLSTQEFMNIDTFMELLAKKHNKGFEFPSDSENLESFAQELNSLKNGQGQDFQSAITKMVEAVNSEAQRIDLQNKEFQKGRNFTLEDLDHS